MRQRSSAMPVLCLLSLISRNSPKQLGMVSPELRGMDVGPWNASRMDHFKISGRVPHERRYLHTLRPFILTSMIEIVMIHVRIFIFLLHSHARFLQ